MATFIAYVISRALYHSAYDAMAKLQKLPFLPALELRRYRLKAKHIMEDDLKNKFVRDTTTLRDLRKVLKNIAELGV
jgi:hypothetical protein